MPDQPQNDYTAPLRLLLDKGLSPTAPQDDPQWAELAKIAAYLIEADGRSFISLVPKNSRQMQIVQMLRQNLVALIETPQLLSPAQRAMCGKLLSRLGDPRPGVGVREDGLPDMDWCEVPAGQFLFQDGERLNLPTFKIAKYPVTYAQYQAFLDAQDGYYTLDWLHELPEESARHWHEQERYYIEWDQLLNSLSDEDRKAKHAADWQDDKYWNHPRVMVAWEEAIAFCGWLSAKLGFEVRLPTTQEWEKAARGTEGLLYPYGNQFDPTKGNTSETGIGGTSAVGLFPDGASPYGVLDMTGNVFEWMLNEWDGSIVDNIANVQVPMLRGGSYSESKDASRATYLTSSPSEKRQIFGFRVLRPG